MMSEAEVRGLLDACKARKAVCQKKGAHMAVEIQSSNIRILEIVLGIDEPLEAQK
jgi:hypothetical protein